jgi:hypothetical protein
MKAKDGAFIDEVQMRGSEALTLDCQFGRTDPNESHRLPG